MSHPIYLSISLQVVILGQRQQCDFVIPLIKKLEQDIEYSKRVKYVDGDPRSFEDLVRDVNLFTLSSSLYSTLLSQ